MFGSYIKYQTGKSNQILRKPSAAVDMGNFNCADRALCDKINHELYHKYVYDHLICGLAAPQIGENKRIIGVSLGRGLDKPRERLVLINPEIVYRSGFQMIPEECLSLPYKTNLVPRYNSVIVLATTQGGEEIILKERWFNSIILQHEIDHLDGILMCDYSLFRRTPKSNSQNAKIYDFDPQKNSGEEDLADVVSI